MKVKKRNFFRKNILVHATVIIFLLVLSVLLSIILLSRSSKNFINSSAPNSIKGKIIAPNQGALLGIYLSDQSYENLLLLENKLAIHFAIVGRYQSWGEKNNQFNAAWANIVASHNSIPLITWEPWVPISGYDRSESKVDQKNYRLNHIANGDFDSYIKQYADDIKRYGRQIFVRFAHEMNGNWYPWGSTFNNPEDYVAAWRHVHDIFVMEGATNVTWLWAPNEVYEDANIPYSNQIEKFYPGDDYVDWVGFSSFNWAGLYKQNVWRNPVELFPSTVAVLSTFDKPLMIAETASAQSAQSKIGNRKADWIHLLALYIKETPQIKGVLWFNTEDNGIDWKIEQTSSSTEAFSKAFDGYFIQNIAN